MTEEVTSTVSPQWAEVKVSRETLIQRWDRRHSTEPPPESAEAGEIRMYRPLEPGPAASETVMIRYRACTRARSAMTEGGGARRRRIDSG